LGLFISQAPDQDASRPSCGVPSILEGFASNPYDYSAAAGLFFMNDFFPPFVFKERNSAEFLIKQAES